jgi:hypothetical protein
MNQRINDSEGTRWRFLLQRKVREMASFYINDMLKSSYLSFSSFGRPQSK